MEISQLAVSDDLTATGCVQYEKTLQQREQKCVQLSVKRLQTKGLLVKTSVNYFTVMLQDLRHAALNLLYLCGLITDVHPS